MGVEKEAWQQGAGTALGGRQRENSVTQLSKTLADSSAPWAQVATGSPRAWLNTAVSLLCISGHSFSSPALSRGVGAWRAAWTRKAGLGIPTSSFGTSAARAAPHRDSCRLTWAWCLLAGTLKQRPQLRQGAPALPWQRTALVGCCSSRFHSPCPHTSSSSCTWLKMKWKRDSPVQLLNWGQEEMFQKQKMISATTWVIDSVLSIFICLMWFIIAGADFQGESLKYCSCCCYKGYLLNFFS